MLTSSWDAPGCCNILCAGSTERSVMKISTTKCFSSASIPFNLTSIESPGTNTHHEIPPEYLAFQDVFSKQLATKLPPHGHGTLAFDLLPGATLPKGKVYPLSIPKQKAREEYIEEVHRRVYLLRPCIDYCTLNSKTIKYRYPLPLLSAVQEQLHGARIFLKLDLWSA